MEETRGGCSSLPRPTQLDVEMHSPSHPVPQGGAREVKQIDAPAPAAAPSVLETGERAYVAVFLQRFRTRLYSLFHSGENTLSVDMLLS